MDNILVVGVETVVGANLAAALSGQAGVTGISPVAGIAIEGCPVHGIEAASTEQAGGVIADSRANQVVYCGPAARSSWEPGAAECDESLIETAGLWAQAAQQQGCRFTMISSDGVFTGPWMFHEEEGSSHCSSAAAAIIRAAEAAVCGNCPEALVVRTNAFGWSPLGDRGWIEQRLAEVRTRRLADQDCIRHATPILATDLAGILTRAWTEQLAGTYHIAGAERINPLKFVQRLAERFELPWLSIQRGEPLQELAVGFGAGECSLQTKKLRKALCVAMPMLTEGLDRLADQDASGFRARLTGRSVARQERAA